MYSVKINGAPKRPAVCYALTDDVAAAVESLAKAGQARIYDEEVRFVSGRAIPVRPIHAPAVPAPAPVVLSVPSVPEPETLPAPVPEPEASEPAVEDVTPAVVEDPASDFADAPDAEQSNAEAVSQDEPAAVEESVDADEESGSARKPSRRTKQPA
jgi:hypothetical protein